MLAQALSANTHLRVRPFDHGIEPGLPSRFAGARVDLVDETFLVRAPSGRAKPLDFIFVAQCTLPAFLDPSRLRVGTEMRVWVVGRIVGGAFRASPVPWSRAKRPGDQVPPNRKSSAVRREASVKPVSVRVPSCKVTLMPVLSLTKARSENVAPVPRRSMRSTPS